MQKYKKIADRYGYLMAGGHIPENAPVGEVGGTAILIPHRAIPRGKNEGKDVAITKVSRTARETSRITSIKVSIEGKKTKLVSAYAPPTPAARPDFFNDDLRPAIGPTTVLGIDANCVLDTALDIKSHAANQPNTGGAEFAAMLAHAGLVDVARERLGFRKAYTSHHNMGGGKIVQKRIDYLLAPEQHDWDWDIESSPTHDGLLNAFFPSLQESGMPDHIAVTIQARTTSGERGRDVTSVSEAIYEDPRVQGAVEQILKKYWELKQQQRTPEEAWDQVKSELSQLATVETIDMREAQKLSSGSKEKQRRAAEKAVNKGQYSTVEEYQAYKKIVEEEREIMKKLRTQESRLEFQHFNMHHMYTAGTGAFYRRISPAHASQWIAKVWRRRR